MSYESDRINEDIAARLHGAAIRLLRLVRREDVAAGLSAPRLSALSVLVFAGPLSLAELAAAEQVRPPTMSRIVDALVKAGLATRETDARDRRAVRIAATDEGRELLEEGRRRRVRVLAARLAALGPSEQRALARGVELIEQVSRG
ncbi:MarR family winged helix-turn-helix transcriptional regulator [Allosphingosinicella indica]|uniref:Transcriptional regulator, MarR family n=1 Tax=Allosphingosinicella indica TaxID=941907 RepID=A0A1X7FZZ6_9SPHN|nr:MarR family transcriptional regulator [Allosphingosinicella indica]SMF61586.1 transcriptional regulator, MarR family [Allosphingosinicella indica]